MTSPPSLITVPLPPATGSSIDESVRRPASRPCLRRPNSSKAGEFSNGTFGEFTSGTDTLWRPFQLPTSWIGPDGDANGNVVEAGEAAPHDHVAGRRIAVAGEIAAEHGDLQQVVGKRPALQSWSSACRIDAVERADLGGGEDSVGRRIRFGAGRHGDEEDAPADHCDEGEKFHQPLSALQSGLLRATSRLHHLMEDLSLPAQGVPVELLDGLCEVGNRHVGDELPVDRLTIGGRVELDSVDVGQNLRAVALLLADGWQ